MEGNRGPLSSINAQAGPAAMASLPSRSELEGAPASAASALSPQPSHPTPASLLLLSPLPPSLIFPTALCPAPGPLHKLDVLGGSRQVRTALLGPGRPLVHTDRLVYVNK